MLYIFFLTTFLVLISIVIKHIAVPTFQNVILLVIVLLGPMFCYVWVINIRSYLQLNSRSVK